MTPNEIIQAIKTSPIKERQAERNICDFAIDYLKKVLTSVELNKKMNYNLQYSAQDSARRDYFAGCFDEAALTIPIIEQHIEQLETYKETGSYGDLL